MMDVKRLSGPGAGALKYDILTALGVLGVYGSPGLQTSMQRLNLVLTARYNWARAELSLGQQDMARLWAVNARTAKREVKRLTEMKLLVCTRPGVRGRVACYRLNLPEVFRLSEPYWAQVGSDFAERMTAQSPLQSSSVVKVDFGGTDAPVSVVKEVEPTPREGSWQAVARRIEELQPGKYRHWISQLTFVSDDGRRYALRAPGQFAARYVQTHLLELIGEAVESEVGPMRRIDVQA